MNSLDLFFSLVIYLVKNLVACPVGLPTDQILPIAPPWYPLTCSPVLCIFHDSVVGYVNSRSKKSQMALTTSNKIKLMFCFYNQNFRNPALVWKPSALSYSVFLLNCHHVKLHKHHRVVAKSLDSGVKLLEFVYWLCSLLTVIQVNYFLPQFPCLYMEDTSNMYLMDCCED